MSRFEGGLLSICARATGVGASPSAASTGGGAATPTILPGIVLQRLREARGEKKGPKKKIAAASAETVAEVASGLNLFFSSQYENLNPHPSSRIALMGPQPDSWEPLRPQGVMAASADPTTGPAPAQIALGPIRVTGVEIQEATSRSAIIRVQADQPVASYNTFVLTNPPRLVIDITGALMAESMARQATGKGPIIRIRASQYRWEPQPVVRVVLDLASPLPYQVAGIPETFQILVGEAVAKAGKTPPAVPRPVPPERPKPAPEEGAAPETRQPPAVTAEQPKPAPEEPAKVPEPEEPLWRNVGVWGSGEYESLNRNVTTFEDGYDSSIWRVTVGADYQFTDRIVAGLAFDAYWQNGDFDGGGDFSNNSYGGLVFGSFLPTDSTFIQISGGYSGKFNDRNRVATFVSDDVTPFSRTGRPNADFNPNEFSAGMLAGYDYVFRNLTVSPRIGLDWIHTDFGTYSETGDSGLALTFYDDAQTSVQTRLGAQALIAFSTGFGVVAPQAGFYWKHEFANDQRTVEVSFVDDTKAQRFTYLTDPPDRDWFEINAGIVVVLPKGFQLFGNYRTIVGNSLFNSHAGTIGIRYTF